MPLGRTRYTKCLSCGWRGPLAEWMKDKRCPQCGITEAHEPVYRSVFGDLSGFPKWYTLLLEFIVFPIKLWPLIFFSSCFVFDSGEMSEAIPIFIGINCYPIVLYGTKYLSVKTYRKNRKLGIVLLAMPVVFYTLFAKVFNLH